MPTLLQTLWSESLVALVAAVLVALVGMLGAVPGSAASAQSSYDNAAYTYDPTAHLPGPMAATTRARRSTAEPKVAGSVSTSSLYGYVVATQAASCSVNSFTADTPVLLADGTSKPIDLVKVGDQVQATDPQTGEDGARPVTQLIRHAGPHTMVDLTLADGSVLHSTDRHPIWDATDRTFTYAIDLHPGEQLRRPDGTLLTLAAVTVRQQTLTAYNLTIAGIHTYYAGTTPLLVHNSCGAPPANLSPAGAGRSGAFRQAKADSGIPRSQQPSEVGPNLSRTGSSQPGRTYTFRRSDGTATSIREDSAGHDFGLGDPQNRGPHFNTEDGGHYDY